MNGDSPEVKEHSDALVFATQELAIGVLDIGDVEVVGVVEQMPATAQGPRLCLANEQGTVELCFGTDDAGAQALARALLGLEPDEEMAEDEVRDANGEILNILAGAVKSRLIEHYGSIQLGIPDFCSPLAPHQDVCHIVELRLGTHRVFASCRLSHGKDQP